ncbi:MAG: hypothetical protein K6B65_02000 [Bacilli bacterium]|nr:hypothetical protein [Bacilli bacterium]
MVKKLLSGSNIAACLTAILSLVMLILYGVNVSAEGFYFGMSVDGFVVLSIFALIFSLAIIGVSFAPLKGVVAKVVNVVVMVLKVLIPVFLFIVVIGFVHSRVAGFGYIYGSNVDVIKEVQTPANLASATVAITTIVFGVLASITGIVGAFFLPKEEVEAAA